MINEIAPDFTGFPGRNVKPRSYKLAPRRSQNIDVSIVTPYFNTEELFLETFFSIQAQTFQNWEWVIVNDGSSDTKSLNRLADVAAKDARIRVIHQENAGPAAARNKAFCHANGKYICLLDSDDLIEPTYLEKCIWFLESNPEFAFCNSYSVVFGDQEYLWTTGFETGKQHLRNNSGPPISVVRRTAFEEAGGFDETIRFGHEDWDFWLAMAKVGRWGFTLPEYLQWYRKRGDGRYEQIMRSGNVNAAFEAHMLEKYADLEDRFPAPQRRPAEPYETISATWSLHNPLQPNSAGRRIMYLLPWMVVGGADRVNLDLIEGLTKNGHDVTVCATLTTWHTWMHKFTELTPDVFVLPTFLQPADYPRFLAYLIKSRQIDTVVVTGSTVGYQLLPYLRAVAPHTAFVDLNHVEEPHWLNGGHPRFGVGYQDMLDLNVVTTGWLGGWMTQRGADSSRIRVLYTGVRPPPTQSNPQSRQASRDIFGIPEDATLIVFAGRISEQKRPAMLAEILREARNQGLRFHALLIGDGPLRPELEGLLDQYDLRAFVQMAGPLPHERWLEILVGADILLMPSQYEGISMALLEAMAAGVVPVVANVGGQGEIVDSGCGYLIDHGEGEVQAYVKSLAELLGQPNRLAAASATCRQLMSSSFSWAQTILNFEQILDEAHSAKVGRVTQFSLAAGIELATQAMELRRVNDALDWLWHEREARIHHQGIRRMALLASRSRLGRLVVNNQAIRNAVRALLVGIERVKIGKHR